MPMSYKCIESDGVGQHYQCLNLEAIIIYRTNFKNKTSQMTFLPQKWRNHHYRTTSNIRWSLQSFVKFNQVEHILH